MAVNILAVGDVAGENGLQFLCEKLRSLKKLKNASFVAVNGENAAVTGITPKQADAVFSAGADVITLGNHSFGKKNIIPYLDDTRGILRPANLSPLSPGLGWDDYDTSFGTVRVINLIGRCGMDFAPDNPFFAIDRILKDTPPAVTLVDFHAEATSEKLAMAYHLDGRVSALWGTHTHVQTSDACVFPNGMGYITDLGMTGPVRSVIGIRPEQSLALFRGDPDRRPYESAPGECKLEGALFEIDERSGRCLSVEAIRII